MKNRHQVVLEKVSYMKNQCLAAARRTVCTAKAVEALEYDFDVLERMVEEPLLYDMERVPEAMLIDEVLKRIKQKTLVDVSLAMLQVWLEKAMANIEPHQRIITKIP